MAKDGMSLNLTLVIILAHAVGNWEKNESILL